MSGAATFDSGFSDPVIERIFNASGRVARMLQFESALATAQADLELIPHEAATAIAAACERSLDADAIIAAGWSAGTPVIPLINEVRRFLPSGAAEWLHHRATTQDVVDTAMILQVGDATAVVAGTARRIITALESAIERFGDRRVMARTLMQPALPTTFRQRATAGWLAPLQLQVAAVTTAAVNLPIQLGGPIGDGTGLPPELVSRVATGLGLVAPAMSWHTDRTPISSMIGILERMVGAAAKVAYDLVLLSQPEIGEVTMRAGGSSSMSQKRNPADAVHALAAADVCGGIASIITRARPHELERAAGSWHAEWFAVPMVFHTATACLNALAVALESMEVISSG